MLANRGFRLAAQVRFMATEVSDSVAAAAASGSSTLDSEDKMSSLLDKLSSITNAKPGQAAEGMINSKKKPFKKASGERSNEKRELRKHNSREKNFNNNSGQRRNNNNKFQRERQTVSHFDKIRNVKKSTTVSAKSEGSLNESGLSFAELQEQKALYIRRKLDTQEAIKITTPGQLVYDFIVSSAIHKSLIYDPLVDKFAPLKAQNNAYKLAKVNKVELELSKEKMSYSVQSRLLRALEQLTTKRGFKLVDVEKRNSQYLPYSAGIYPYANTTLPNNLLRPFANLKNLKNISKEEIVYTIATVVRGERQELIVDPKTEFPTERAKLNAHVVVNNLNRNAQLQVDNLHKSMAPVMLGQSPVKTLPQPILPPKKI